MYIFQVICKILILYARNVWIFAEYEIFIVAKSLTRKIKFGKNKKIIISRSAQKETPLRVQE